MTRRVRNELDLELRAQMLRARRVEPPTPAGAAGRLPDVLVIGTPRGGTTSVATHLAAHPGIFVAPEKEVHFFDSQHVRGLDWYRTRFAGATPGQLCCDATPTYLANPQALDRMTQALNRPRLIAVLRNPVDRAYSTYWYQKVLLADTFENVIDKELAGRETASPLLQPGRYAQHLRRVHELFGADSVHVVLFDDLRRDTLGAMHEIYRYLGVDDGIVPPHADTPRNIAAGYRSERLVRFMLRRGLYGRLPRLATATDRLNRVPRRYPPLDAGLRRRLVEHFAPDNTELSELLGRDLDAWSH